MESAKLTKSQKDKLRLQKLKSENPDEWRRRQDLKNEKRRMRREKLKLQKPEEYREKLNERQRTELRLKSKNGFETFCCHVEILNQFFKIHF